MALDEPINGLDPQGIIEIRELILRLNRERGITVLISSHILDELSKLATDYGFIDSGSIVKEISAANLEAAYRRCLRVSVSDIVALSVILDKMNIDYKIIDGTSADSFGNVNISHLALSLAERSCELISASERDESLESYYVGLVGGGGGIYVVYVDSDTLIGCTRSYILHGRNARFK